MPRELSIRTPESVEITHTLAGIGSRFLAVAFDHLLQGLLFLFVVFVLLSGGGIAGWLAAVNDPLHLSVWLQAALVAFWFLDFWGYFIFFETVWNGQTPGKRLVGIRVVKENGQPVDFFSSAIRNLVRVLDAAPSLYAIGVVTIFFSPAYKRVGDYAAGTVVVKEYREPKPPKKAPSPVQEPVVAGQMGTSEAPLREEAGYAHEAIHGVTVPSIRQVSREEYEAARRFLERRTQLPASVGSDLARRLAEPILARLEMTPEDPQHYPYELFLETLAQDYLLWYDRRY